MRKRKFFRSVFFSLPASSPLTKARVVKQIYKANKATSTAEPGAHNNSTSTQKLGTALQY